MHASFSIALGAVLALCAPQAALATGPGPAGVLPAARPIAGQYIVVLRDGAASGPTLEAAVERLASKHNAAVAATWRHAVKGFVAQMSRAQAEALAADPSVALVEEDGLVHAEATQLNPPWGLDRIDQRYLPLSASFTYAGTGLGVNAYIIDTGIRATHVEFGGRVSGGFTAVNDGRGTDDCNGHGTHVAGVVGAKTYGVAKGVHLVPIRVFDCTGAGATSAVIAGVDWVTANHVKPAVANMSLGGAASAAMDAAVQNSINAGVVYTIAAGGSGGSACNYSPARVAAALTVGATDATDRRASSSNYGPCLDLFAPGVNIISTWYTSDTATATLSGTSFSAAFVAGAVALYFNYAPTTSPGLVPAAIVANATPGVVVDPGVGSPNLLLYTRPW